MKNIILSCLFVYAVVWLWTNVIAPPEWIGFYYPDIDDLTKYQQSSELKTLDECKDWVDDAANGRTDSNYAYECGKGCKLDTSINMYVCKETIDW